jgi:hypothetical protein
MDLQEQIVHLVDDDEPQTAKAADTKTQGFDSEEADRDGVPPTLVTISDNRNSWVLVFA